MVHATYHKNSNSDSRILFHREEIVFPIPTIDF